MYELKWWDDGQFNLQSFLCLTSAILFMDTHPELDFDGEPTLKL